ncbi:MAG TPA: hypothetical protein VGB70_11160 [Allosphingosinicella sp.]
MGKVLARARALGGYAPIFVRAAAGLGRRRLEPPLVILHAGEHKTGTTTLQAVFKKDRRLFARQGIYVLRAGQGSDGAHHRLIYALTGQPLGRVSPRLLRAELTQAAPRTVLISSETAKKAMVQGRGDQLIDALRDAGAGRVRLLLYLRSPFGLANASYSGLTSRLELAGAKFAEFLKVHNEAPAYDYHHILALAERDDVELVVRPYSSIARRSIVADFAETLGLDLSQVEEPRHNGSFGPVGLEALRQMGAEHRGLSVKQRHRLRRPLMAIARALAEEPFWGIDAEHEALLSAADSSTEAFALAVWNKGWREVIGEERRPLNLFDPDNNAQRALLETALHQMRRAASRM